MIALPVDDTEVVSKGIEMGESVHLAALIQVQRHHIRICFFDFLEDFSGYRPVIDRSVILIFIFLQTILFGNAEFIADIGSHAETAEFYILFICRKSIKNVVHAARVGKIFTQCIFNSHSFFGIHKFIHIIDTAHVDPACCVSCLNREYIERISAGKHQLHFFLIVC